MTLIVQLTLVSLVPLLIVALGGLMSEKSGVTNIALEGLMLLGAFVGVWVIRDLQNAVGFLSTEFIYFLSILVGVTLILSIILILNKFKKTWYCFLSVFITVLIGMLVIVLLINLLQKVTLPLPMQLIYLIGIIVGGLVGGLFAMTHAIASIKFNADQTISATAINLFAPAFAIYTARSLQGAQQIRFSAAFRIDKVPFLGDIPIIGEWFFQKTYISLFIAAGILAFVWILLYKTKSGLRIRAVGENPQAADAQGINIYKIRYLSVFASGILAGIGGVIFVVTTSASFDATVAGMGFLAIAVLIFGNWHPGRILLSAIVFGFFRTIASAYSAIGFLRDLDLDTEIYQMIPFVITLIVLAITSRNSRAPKAIGQIYEMGKR